MPPLSATQSDLQVLLVVCLDHHGSVPKSVEKERGVSSDVIALDIGFQRSPYSHDPEVA
jgi:hypothetical protein